MKSEAKRQGYTLSTINSFPGFTWDPASWHEGAPKTEAQWKKSPTQNLISVQMAMERSCKIMDIGREPGKSAHDDPISRYNKIELNLTRNHYNLHPAKSAFANKILG